MQKHVNLVDLVKSFPTNIFLQNLASIQKRTRPIKFAHLAEKSEKGSVSNLSTKVQPGELPYFLASGCTDFTIKIWNVGTGKCVTMLEGHADWVRQKDTCDPGEGRWARIGKL